MPFHLAVSANIMFWNAPHFHDIAKALFIIRFAFRDVFLSQPNSSKSKLISCKVDLNVAALKRTTLFKRSSGCNYKTLEFYREEKKQKNQNRTVISLSPGHFWPRTNKTAYQEVIYF